MSNNVFDRIGNKIEDWVDNSPASNIFKLSDPGKKPFDSPFYREPFTWFFGNVLLFPFVFLYLVCVLLSALLEKSIIMKNKIYTYFLKNFVWKYTKKSAECVEFKSTFLNKIMIYHDDLDAEQKAQIKKYCESTFPQMFTTNFFLKNENPKDNIPKQALAYLRDTIGTEYKHWEVDSQIVHDLEIDDYVHVTRIVVKKGLEDHLSMIRMLISDSAEQRDNK